MKRRRFFQVAGTGIAFGSSLLCWATCIEPHWVEVTYRSLPLVNLPPSLIGKRLVQLSDFHIGRTNLDYLRTTMGRVNELKADFHVFTGDFIDRDFPQASDHIQAVFAELQPPTISSVGCLGNHDYSHGWSQVDVADRVARILSELGIQILRDEQVNCGGLVFYGLDDFWSPRYLSRQVMENATSTADGICLCHNPDVCDQRVWGEFSGAILAGHTHGGQCKPPFFSPPRTPVSNKRYVSGFYDIGNRRTLYINRGVGHGLAARFNCRPEITVFTLEQA
jgi:uncharacterized protein